MAVVKTLDDYINELEGTDAPSQGQGPPAGFHELARKVSSLREAYLQAKAAYDAAAIELVQLMWDTGLKKETVDDLVLSAGDQVEVSYDPNLADALKDKLSPRQWAECFEAQPPKILKKGINKYLKHGGPASEIIQAHQVISEKRPVPSALRFSKAKTDE